MPIIQSAAKRVRQDKTRYRRNLSYKRAMKSAVKNVTDAVSSGDEKAAKEQLPLAQKAIDKAVKQGVVHKNTASRKKSQLIHQIETAFGDKKATPKSKDSNQTKSTAKKNSTSKTKSSSATAKSKASN